MTAAVVRVPFNGDEILTTEVDGKPNVILKPALESIGLDYSSQLQKLKGKSWATVGLSTIVAEDGKPREMATADVRTFLMLLATIDDKRVGEAVRPKLVAYQAEVADAIEAYWTRGAAINPHATEEQIEQVQETLTEIAKRRLEEKMDYKSILHALKAGGAVDDEYRHVQNTLYLLLFGMTAAAIRATQPQRTGVARKRGDGFRKSIVAKDYLTESQLALLNATVLATTAQISLRCPQGASAGQMLDAISRAVSMLAPAQLRVAS